MKSVTGRIRGNIPAEKREVHAGKLNSTTEEEIGQEGLQRPGWRTEEGKKLGPSGLWEKPGGSVCVGKKGQKERSRRGEAGE